MMIAEPATATNAVLPRISCFALLCCTRLAACTSPHTGACMYFGLHDARVRLRLPCAPLGLFADPRSPRPATCSLGGDAQGSLSLVM